MEEESRPTDQQTGGRQDRHEEHKLEATTTRRRGSPRHASRRRVANQKVCPACLAPTGRKARRTWLQAAARVRYNCSKAETTPEREQGLRRQQSPHPRPSIHLKPVHPTPRRPDQKVVSTAPDQSPFPISPCHPACSQGQWAAYTRTGNSSHGARADTCCTDVQTKSRRSSDHAQSACKSQLGTQSTNWRPHG